MWSFESFLPALIPLNVVECSPPLRPPGLVPFPAQIAAHGNSLRALVKHLDNIPEDVITGLNIPTGESRSTCAANLRKRRVAIYRAT